MDQNTRNTRGALAGTKKKTTTVREVVDGDDIPTCSCRLRRGAHRLQDLHRRNKVATSGKDREEL